MRGWIVLAAGCGAGGGAGHAPIAGDGTDPSCASGATYPEVVADEMTLGEVLPPYRWSVAVDRRTDERLPLDLADAPCDLDAALGWGRHDALLFVSIPAW